MKKKIIVFLLLFCSGIIMNYSADNLNVKHITTDSGFDTGYGGGSSSWDSGGSSGWDSGGSSRWDSGHSSSWDSDRRSSGENNNKSDAFILYIILGAIFLFYIKLMIDLLILKSKEKTSSKNVPYSERLYPGEEKTPEVEKILDEAYQIFIGVQKSWMDFDYNELRELVTDELYNMYYNQLQTLSVKGEKNIMTDFKLIQIELISRRIDNDISIYTIGLIVSFNDYIVDSNNNILKGSDTVPVEMYYKLFYVKDNNSTDKCPNCGSKLENGITMCPYCRSRVQGISSKMKLSKKKVISQR